MTVTDTPRLFQPINVGSTQLKHRLVMAPLTRFRSPKHVPTELVAEYYEQRASVEGTLLITEATFISPEAGGYDNVPGIWNEEQVAAWKKVTDRVHAKGSKIYMQLWALGRAASPDFLEKQGLPYVSASDVAMKDKKAPRPLTKDEIKEYVQMYVKAAKNAVTAGFDGIEIHDANGYLLDQFLHASTNKRTDEYGGSIENRARFPLEVVDALVDAIGADKVGIRLSPWGEFGEMDPDVSAIPQFSYFVCELERRRLAGKALAYIHVVEPRVVGNTDADEIPEGYSNQFIIDIWKGPVVRAGGLASIAVEIAEENDRTLVGVGRYFISNPDLPFRIAKDIKLTPYDRDTFYTNDKVGYTTYELSPTFSSKI